ncbi:tol-pal system-associated acyl-CoA thioesterase [Algicella marina]|uniref:Tol-pal system-associated acyl-CoA thioesterase n=1 Tax=Algicella marina TaxID=2683284 RepID=A0A6P1T695_9RHOB|nr:tol-pal system-associated acyl-CoA thioesterase [Algicella marina]QHQ37210.1 tol-pal system-associated acyl-CoA thioesterase [Algicella marina]
MTHRMSLRVYYEDTDMAGIVYYANYLKFLERGRSDAVREVGCDQLDMRDRLGIVFVVRRVEIDYLAPARMDDVLVVETVTSKLGGATMVMDQRVLRGETVLVAASVKVAIMSLGGRPARLPAEIRQQLATLME